MWWPEIQALYHQRFFVRLWDRMLNAENKLSILASASFDRLYLGEPAERTKHEHSIRVTRYADPAEDSGQRALTPKRWRNIVTGLREAGWRLEMSEWRHVDFQMDPPRSSVSFRLFVHHAERPHRLVVRGVLEIDWSGDEAPKHPRQAETPPTPATVRVTDLRVAERRAAPAFEPMMQVEASTGPFDARRIEPLLLHDLNRDGLSEIILPPQNAIYRNLGGGNFERQELTPYPSRFVQPGAALADFSGDGRADLVIARGDGAMMLMEGTASGRFSDYPRVINTPWTKFHHLSAVAAGDIEGDNDLDMWATQYKPPYVGGQFPEPYYDANDGYRSFLFRNEAGPRFREVTRRVGLDAKRRRRTYSASFIDIDRDGDQDLIVVSDFSGVDMYTNDGAGHFTDVSDRLPKRHNFGMSHTFDDFNGDGKLDFLVIGMSSYVVRRLQRMGLGRKDFPEHQKHRAAMGGGNRLYLGDGEGHFRLAEVGGDLARTGWSWGSSSFDFDNDGDRDVYVANGHASFESTEDYCSTFWRHDIYGTRSRPSQLMNELYNRVLERFYVGEISWDGYQKNALLMSTGGPHFVEVGYLLGLGHQFDGRAAVTDDLDGDGRVDVLVNRKLRPGPGEKLHVFRNVLPDPGNWIGVRLYGRGDGLTPVGAEVIVHAGEDTQHAWLTTGDSIAAQHANSAHFGLAEREEVDKITVRWPNGEVTERPSPRINRYHQISPAEAER